MSDTPIHVPKAPSPLTVMDTSNITPAAAMMDSIRHTHDVHKVACGVVFLWLADVEQVQFFMTHISPAGAIEICEAGIEQIRAASGRMDAALKALDEQRGDQPVQ